jgi:8-oxo-dGTP pyrophosphatase MutT (NUDIX family)
MSSFLFDPTQVPTEALPPAPALLADRLLPTFLRERLANPPTWQADHLHHQRKPVDNAAPAAVLIPLVVRAQDEPLRVLLTQRTLHLRAHAGQISFPGGRIESHDENAIAAALREAQEEVGLPASRVEVLGQLPAFVTGTGFWVTPVVGLIHAQPDEAHQLQLQIDAGEVAEAFEVPLDFLMDPTNHRYHRLPVGQDVFHYFSMEWRHPIEAKPYFIWGATAGMLRDFYRLLSA